MSTTTRRIVLASSLFLLADCSGGSRTGQYVLGSDLQCVEYGYEGYEEDVEASDFTDLDLEEQSGPELCWAAAIKAVLEYNGKDMSEDAIVKKVRGATGGQNYTAASLREIIRGISGPGSSWHVSNGSSTQLVQDLAAENPVIIGLRGKDGSMGHVVVAYAASYVLMPPAGAIALTSVDIWDPWMGAGLDTMDACDLRRQISFALHAWNP